jgi:cobalt/nickel transport protein
MPERKRKWKIILVLTVILPTIFFSVYFFSLAPKSWVGVDEAVVEKIAKEHGREAKAPLIDPGSGDLLLFAFLVAGALGGFAAGYYWRELTHKKVK